ncbi:MarR family EPS-associated transcriptional regulator [Litorivicinus lipolyticus]|uniref:MarR family EPS-associated transcriptional regulator n=1 Tax=Litorivicinus lipolyticus TaxID=418701 RepID=A0A5Q2Q7X1_9GAMM|nr:MarR family EPS-associated transcriptional regulator [Litorivicinus lipolyticus]QGG79083.1 MarR family EPS-associated transcriptional regulator [Litorivicinus lipolyticus]
MIPEDSQYQVLELIRDKSDLTQREMAQKLGLTLGKTHYSLKALVEAGWIRAERFARSENKSGYIYVLTPTGVAERLSLAARLLARKREEFDKLSLEIRALEGRLDRDGRS